LAAVASRPALGPPRERLAYYARILRVLVATEFKLQYEDASLGYIWSLLKPLALFTVLYIVFGRLLRMGVVFEHFPLYLLVGLVLWIFFSNSTTLAMTSVVVQGSLLRRLSFPRLIIPVAATVNAALTFAISLVAIVALIAWNAITPRLEWFGLIPLLAELYALTLAVSLVLAALYVRFRDVGQIWEVGSQLLFYLTPVIYPLFFVSDNAPRFLPLVRANPMTWFAELFHQMLYGTASSGVNGPPSWPDATTWGVCAAWAVVTLAVGYWLFNRLAVTFAKEV
jgi:ABC-2 type transport system permease protein